ncbi:methyltransferase domain-containing protein [Pyxidicoccus parkwayensis]|uniref:Methyltransferase domain-containing protein n=1 Tax=Pyxidicoccus parkwayensis TaxID=2813578 RepID=A0ABX7P554_9BACT|nr:methyltransferase domain-containing protein [Pyxidicoccus parkwaysis]QSQ25578.1 methyltransferase domain-containing protein [Pyxidicoccus parkwaysis]
MKTVWLQRVVGMLVVMGLVLSIANSLNTFHQYDIPGGAAGLFRHATPVSLALCVLVIACITAVNLAGRYLKWMVLLRAGHVLAPSRKLFLAFLASFIGNLTPFYVLYVLRVAPLRERFPRALALLAVDLATDAVAIGLLASVATYPLLGGAVGVFVAGACALALFPTKSRERRIGLLPMATSLVFAQGFAVLIWGVTGVSLWVTLRVFGVEVAVPEALRIYAMSHVQGLASLTWPGFLLVGRGMIGMLVESGVPSEVAVYSAALVRAFTYWLVLLAAAGALLHIRRRLGRQVEGVNHFDLIADEYKDNVPEHIRLRLLNRKVEVNLCHLPLERFPRGIDAGCGQGWYLKEMLSRGYQVEGIDYSTNQVAKARQYLGSRADLVRQGSLVELPFEDASQDFVYAVNVIHHLPDVERQQQAFREVRRVLRPGGRFLVHEMNVNNPLFRFYMSYVFPLIKDIDDGTEVWLKETTGPFSEGWKLVTTEYRTFLPDFVPEFAYRRLWGVEQYLERNRHAAPFSAHVTFVLEKAGPTEAATVTSFQNRS